MQCDGGRSHAIARRFTNVRESALCYNKNKFDNLNSNACHQKSATPGLLTLTAIEGSFLVLWITHRFERHILGTRTSDPTVIQKFKLIGVLRRFTNIRESACNGVRWRAIARHRPLRTPIHKLFVKLHFTEFYRFESQAGPSCLPFAFAPI